MSGDYSRVTFKPKNNFNGVLMQQGRVQLDADWNEQVAIGDRRFRAETVDIIGRAVVADATPDGFKIELANGNLLIHPGRMYVDGLLAENHGDASTGFDPILDELTSTLPLAYDAQPFFPAPPPLPSGGPHLVYLDVYERECTYLQHDLIEKAVGVDTTARRQTVWQVKLLELDANGPIDCDDDVAEWDALKVPAAGRLTTSTDPAPSQTDPCMIPPDADYRGFDNRLYRIEIHKKGDLTNAKFKWSRVNATVASAIDDIVSTTQVAVRTLGRDDYLRFKIGDWVEILDDRLELHGEAGHMAKVVDLQEEKRLLTLDPPIPAALALDASDPARHTRAIRWDQKHNVDAEGLLDVTAGPVAIEDGIQVSFSIDPNQPGGELNVADHWLFAARTADASIELLEEAPPVGVHHHVAKLAIVTFPDQVIDCRDHWPPWQRTDEGCCTFRVGDGTNSVGDFASIQEAVDNLPAEGGKVCVLPGTFEESIVIQDRENITIHGCGKRSRIVGGEREPLDDDAAITTDAAIHIVDSSNISIENLRIDTARDAPGVLIETSDDERGSVFQIRLHELCINAMARSAIEAHEVRLLTVDNCAVRMAPVITPWPGIFVVAEDATIAGNEITAEGGGRRADAARGGLQLGGTCERVRVIDNVIDGGVGNGITLGSLHWITRDVGNGGGGDEVVTEVPHPHRPDDPCDPCPPGTSRIPNPRDPGDDGDDSRLRSAGDLYEIVIRNNRIYRMGLNGVGVVGFFPLDVMPDVIAVTDLSIVSNEIRSCLAFPLEDIPEDMLDQMGYGGIALADVTHLVVQHNRIENNGPSDSEPVCGVFVLHGEGVDVTDNKILGNGAKSAKPRGSVKPGPRAGIHLVLVTAPETTEKTSSAAGTVPAWSTHSSDWPAANIHDNVVSQPLGRAVALMAAGPVSVLDNQLSSHGVAATTQTGATVWVLNLGSSPDIDGHALNFRGSVASGARPSERAAIAANGRLRFEEARDAKTSQALTNGNVMFCNNQCSLLLREPATGVSSSVAIWTLDDLAFHDNQCDTLLVKDLMDAHAWLFGTSIRTSDNRFKEGLADAAFSAVTIGMMNATTNNQSTHCLLVMAVWPGMKTETGNLAVVEAAKPGLCADSRRFLASASDFKLGKLL